MLRVVLPLVFAIGLLGAGATAAQAGGYSDQYGDILHSSGYLYRNNHGDHTYDTNTARYFGSGSSAPIFAYGFYTDWTVRSNAYSWGDTAITCLFSDCADHAPTTFYVGMSQQSGYAHTLRGFATA